MLTAARQSFSNPIAALSSPQCGQQRVNGVELNCSGAGQNRYADIGVKAGREGYGPIARKRSLPIRLTVPSC
jgi:hypothetical protein